MTAIAPTYTYHPPTPRLNLWPWILLAVMVAGTVYLSDHVIRHTSAKSIVETCQQNGADIILRKDANGHCAKLVEMSPDQWGRQIEDSHCNILTAFMSECRPNMNTLPKAIRNLWNSGYKNIEYARPDLKPLIDAIINEIKTMGSGLP